MTEYCSNNEVIIQNICWTCLSTKADLCSMSLEEGKWYRTLVAPDLKTDFKMQICAICRHLLRKFLKYQECCQKANYFIINIYKQDKNLFPPQEICHNFTKTTEVFYLGPGTELDLKTEDDPEIIFENETFTDDDELPLMMLKSDENDDVCIKKVKKKKRKKTEDHDLTQQEIKSENEMNQITQNQENGKCRKSKKVVKDGFSSRMVQETKEYLVIKLTKDQVLKEMEDNSNSEKFKRSLYKCEKCVKGFNFEDVLRSHLKKHSKENGEYQCEICTQYCPSTVSLRGHIKSHTTRYKCKICGSVRLSRQHLLEHHAISHTAEATQYSCEHCYFTTNKRTVIQRHVKSHKKSERQQTCEECGRLFHNIESLRVHTARHDKSRNLQCEYCTRKFIYPSLLQKHVQSVHVHKDYYCVECDVKFKSLDNLKLHFKKAKKHRDTSSYTHECQQCSEKFFTSSSLSVHLTTVHGEPKVHSCSICRRLYSSRESLLTHVRRVHGDKRPQHCCLMCTKVFSRSSILQAHMRSHTNARPYDDKHESRAE